MKLVLLLAMVWGFGAPRRVHFSNSQNSFELDYSHSQEYNIKSQVWQIYTDEHQLKNLARDRDFYFWGGDHVSNYIVVEASIKQKVEYKLNTNNIKHKVVVSDLYKSLLEENPHVGARMGTSRLTWKAYHSTYSIYKFLNYLARKFPELCSVKTIGTSVEGRPIKLMKISNGNPGNTAVFIEGGIHAREWISIAAVTYIINKLATGFTRESRAVQNTDWYFVPVLNPDGYEYSRANFSTRWWRKNRAPSNNGCEGVDLNRNFGYKWGGLGVSNDPCMDTFGGTEPFSEPETRAVKKYIKRHPKVAWKAYVAFHSFGQNIVYPWGFDRVVPRDFLELDRVGRKMADAIVTFAGRKYTVGSSGVLLYPASGGSDDWAKGSGRFKYVYTIELRGNVDDGYGFMLPAKNIIPASIEALRAVRVLAGAKLK